MVDTGSRQVDWRIRSSSGLLEQVDAVAAEYGLSRNEWVRSQVIAAIKENALKNARIAAIAAYDGEPEL